jgi:imidazole glycerol-phosphate synthase subunit HisH
MSSQAAVRRPKIAILDYGMGNLRSVQKALVRAGADAVIDGDGEIAAAADGLILPGVGAFPRAMRRVRELGLDGLIADRLAAGTPVLGICLGFQLAFESSSELGGAAGLGLLAGDVDGLDAPGLKVPHIGWEPVSWERDCELVDGIADRTPFYFVHAFAPRPADSTDVLGTAEHGERFVCAIARPPLYGVQFHPEKSSVAGLRLLRNFAAICTRAEVSQPAA